jgi:thiol-disulfide isomerase/thioredoxin
MILFIKRTILLQLFFSITYLVAGAQTTLTKPVEEYGFNQKTVVTTASGIKYAYANWSKMMATGKYKLIPVHADSDSTEFVLSLRDSLERPSIASLPKPTLYFKLGNRFIFINSTDVTGTLIPAEELKGKIVVINFWFIACPPCRYEIPELNRVAAAYKNDKDVVFLAITIDKKDDVTRFLKVAPFNFRVIPDSEPYFSFYGVSECPVNLVINKKGLISFQSVGYNDGSVPYWINRTIKEIKAEQ